MQRCRLFDASERVRVDDGDESDEEAAEPLLIEDDGEFRNRFQSSYARIACGVLS